MTPKSENCAALNCFQISVNPVRPPRPNSDPSSWFPFWHWLTNEWQLCQSATPLTLQLSYNHTLPPHHHTRIWEYINHHHCPFLSISLSSLVIRGLYPVRRVRMCSVMQPVTLNLLSMFMKCILQCIHSIIFPPPSFDTGWETCWAACIMELSCAHTCSSADFCFVSVPPIWNLASNIIYWDCLLWFDGCYINAIAPAHPVIE